MALTSMLLAKSAAGLGPVAHGTEHGVVHQNIDLAGRVEHLLEQLQDGWFAGLVVLQGRDIQAGLAEDLGLGLRASRDCGWP